MQQKTLEELVIRHCIKKQRPDGSPYKSLLFRDELMLRNDYGLGHKEIQITALQNDIIPERYCRNQASLNSGDQIRLLQAKIAIVGLGGLGGCVTEILARLGIGELILIDGDTFEDSNLNRQLLSDIENLGMKKALAAKKRVELINPATVAHVVPEFLTAENSAAIIGDAHLALDCLDSIPARFLLERECRKKNIPLVSAAIAGTSGQAMVIFPGDTGLHQIYGDPESAPQKGMEKRLGTLPYTAVFMAAIECSEAVNILLTGGSSLHKKLLMTNIKEHHFERVCYE